MTEHMDYQDGVRGMVRIEDDHGLAKARQVSKYQGNLGLTVAQASEIVEVLWPGAPDTEKRAAALLCHSYHLNPLAQHVFLIAYKTKQQDGSYKLSWARVLGIKAKRLMASRPRPGANEYRPVSYEDYSPRIMTEAEQVKLWGKPDPDSVCFITILKDTKTGATVYGTGKWPRNKEPKGTDKGNSQENMAGIRSESAALDRLRPGEMPRDTGVVDENYVEGTVIDELTGEIKGAAPETAHPPPVKAGEATGGIEASTGTPPSPEPVKGNQSGMTEEEMLSLWDNEPKAKPTQQASVSPGPAPTTLNELWAWCKESKITVKRVCEVAGVKSVTEITPGMIPELYKKLGIRCSNTA